MEFVDTHCHIHHLRGKDKQNLLIQNALKAGVTKLVNVACKLSERDACKALAKGNNIWTSIGIHPTSLEGDMDENIAAVRVIAGEDRVVAIGEIGIDYYHDKFPHEVQEEYFTKQLEIAEDLELPAIIHCRAGKNPGENESAFVDLIDILRRTGFNNGVVHCFSGNKVEAEKILDLGLYLGFTGIITFPQNEELREVVKDTPLDRILLETDSPWLPIFDKRGQQSEPAFIADIAKEVAEIKGVPLEEVAKMTTENAERLFGI